MDELEARERYEHAKKALDLKAKYRNEYINAMNNGFTSLSDRDRSRSRRVTLKEQARDAHLTAIIAGCRFDVDFERWIES